MNKDEALKGAIGAEYQKSPWDGKGISMPPPEAPVQDSTCSETLRAQGKAYPRTCKKCGFGPCIALANASLDKMAENARELGLDYEPALKDNSNYRYDPPVAEPVAWIHVDAYQPSNRHLEWKENCKGYEGDWVKHPLYTTPPAAPDLQAELDATNRQVEILSDALAESRREIDALVSLARADERDKWMERAHIMILGEREACAKVCDELHWTWHMGDNSGPKECAAAIRARGNT